ncbi:MAG: hypothetical protein PHG14_03970 [Desulfobacter postgatei]|uniref:hypothetical protein n=1 Tax=Desulfobacter postgatei TaxID=2293 RepID=UPI0023F3FD09|nr:hypothetical protein [Desulfobacter postgatei]MDD4272868.1 hypothetical protein [Desulfobacter postgatei]
MENGHSKEKRSDCPLVTLALVLDSSGFPRCSNVFGGNISEPDTLANIISTMDAGRKSHDMDAGIASEENIKRKSYNEEHRKAVYRRTVRTV